MRPASSDRRPIHRSPIFWIGIALCLAAVAIYLWSVDLSWRPAPVPLFENAETADDVCEGGVDIPPQGRDFRF
jgi:hypothetical protein